MLYMGYHPRIETKDFSNFLTIRSRNSELWFVNNNKLEEAVLGFVAKYQSRYEVKLYALAIEGNHIQSVADFPNLNRAAYQRDLNASIARAVPKYVSTYPGGKLWARRYSNEFLPGAADVEEYFFYTVLQPIQDGLVDSIEDYDGYNCFEDAISGVAKKFKVVRWGAYNRQKRWNKHLKVEDFTEEFELKFRRLPGYEDLSQADYKKAMRSKLRERTERLLAERKGRALGKSRLRLVQPGSRPKNTKRSSATTHRPRILSVCNERRAKAKAWYFDTYFEYKSASAEFRQGNYSVRFPPGTYWPPRVNLAAA